MPLFLKQTPLGSKPVAEGEHDIIAFKKDEFEAYKKELRAFYNNELQKRIKSLNMRFEEEKKNMAFREQQAVEMVHKQYEGVRERIEDLENQVTFQEALNENLLRMSRERSNVDRKLEPKKQHTGYVIVSSGEKDLNYRCGRGAFVNLSGWETVMETHFSIEFSADQAKKEIEIELEEKILEKIGINNTIINQGVKNFVETNGLNESVDFLKNNNVETERRFKANYKRGYWDVYFTHTLPLSLVPKEMREGEQ